MSTPAIKRYLRAHLTPAEQNPVTANRKPLNPSRCMDPQLFALVKAQRLARLRLSRLRSFPWGSEMLKTAAERSLAKADAELNAYRQIDLPLK